MPITDERDVLLLVKHIYLWLFVCAPAEHIASSYLHVRDHRVFAAGMNYAYLLKHVTRCLQCLRESNHFDGICSDFFIVQTHFQYL